jgi:hypothetical protein
VKLFCSNYSPKLILGHGGGKIKRNYILAIALLLISCNTLSGCTFATETNQTIINGNTYTTAQIEDANNRVNTFIETNNRLPNYVTISNQKILINDFLPYMGGINGSTTTTGNTSGSTTTPAAGTISGTSFTSVQINDAAKRVNSFIGTNSRLPNYVTIGNYQITVPQFLQLMAQNIVNINNGITSSITLKTVTSPSSATETVASGSLSKTEYVNIAKNILSNITSTGKAPSTISSSLGTMKYETMVYSLTKILNYYKTNTRLPNYVSVSAWNTGTNSSSVQAILDAIGYAEAKFEDIQGQSSASVMERVGYGDCWADSQWLYNKLNAAGVAARIMGYVGGGTGVWYRHSWVQINTGSGWVNWSYTKYASQHFGDGLGAAAYVLIAASSKIVDVSDMVATGY